LEASELDKELESQILERKLREILESYKAGFIGGNPDWVPLHKVIPPEWWGGWMFMQGDLGPNGDIVCYKHGITRKSLHIDAEGRCWNYHYVGNNRPDIYTPVDSIDAVLAVYKGIEDLGATPSTVYDSDYRERRNQALKDAGFTVIE
jgi:hypothetical protein